MKRSSMPAVQSQRAATNGRNSGIVEEPPVEESISTTVASLQNSHGGASAAPTFQAAGHAAALPAYLMPDRKPKNFADRLMRVLLNDAAPDTLWWVGNGKAVAFHPKNLKKGTLLLTHFKTKDYNAFIRNCNRWGFSRTNAYPVPNGVKVYQCSLFLRDSPHLMLHMRMDSDVQDVFMRHVDDDQRQSKATGKKSVTASMPPPQQDYQHPLAAAHADLHHQGGDLQAMLLQLAQGAATDSGAGNGAARSADPFAPSSIPFAAGMVAATPGLAMNLTQPAYVPSKQGSTEIRQDELLQQILHASSVYLNLPVPPSALGDSTTDPFHTVLQLLQIHGKAFQDGREQQRLQNQRQQQHQQELTATKNAQQTFLMGLLTNAMQQQLHPQGNCVAGGIFSQQQPQLNLPNALLQVPAVGAPTASFNSHTTPQNQDDNSITSIAPSGPAVAGNSSNLLLSLLLGVDGGIQLPEGATGAVPAGSVLFRGGPPATTVAAPTASSSSVQQLGITQVASPPEGTTELPPTAALQLLLMSLFNQDASQRGAS